MSKNIPARSVLETVEAFVKQINAHNVDGIAALMTEDHVFTNAYGNVYCGREEMEAGWVGYFSMFPDFRISVEEMIQDNDTVAVFGTASGTYFAHEQMLDKNRWEIPAAWRAVIKNGLIAEWRVYTDFAPVRQIIAAANH
jgi:ketosteroid isomerase-like protein